METTHTRPAATQTPHDIAALTARLAPYLRAERGAYYRPLWVRRKLGKLLVELGAGPTSPRYIAKFYRRDAGQQAFETLRLLRRHGLRPPAATTVVRPIAYFDDCHVLLQEKAPGRQIADSLFDRRRPEAHVAAGGAEWLLALHSSDAPAPMPRLRVALERYARELRQELPRHERRIEQLARAALAELDAPAEVELVPSHGDYHAENIFVDARGRVTVIDLDTFGLRERAADAAYFLAQTAIMSYFRLGSLAATAEARRLFLQTYEQHVPLERRRLALHMGAAFLQSLHYEHCVLHTNNAEIGERWLAVAERCLLDRDISLEGFEERQ